MIIKRYDHIQIALEKLSYSGMVIYRELIGCKDHREKILAMT